jgi:hypothetical protein
MARLCAIEQVLAEELPCGARKELVWLTPTEGAQVTGVRHRAYGDSRDLLAELTLDSSGPL